MFKKFTESYFHFDDSTNFFWFNFNVFSFIGLSPWRNDSSYRIFKFCSSSMMIVLWFFIIANFYNQLVLMNLEAFTESFSQYIVHMMGLYKFVVLVSLTEKQQESRWDVV
jgi:hypothetical protein